MRIKHLITLGFTLAAYAISVAQTASPSKLTFKYTPFDFVSNDFSGAGSVQLKSVTNISVNAYLYISGNLSANWLINGWGVGSDTELNSIYVYHNENLTFQFSGFGAPRKFAGTDSGAKKIDMKAQVQIYNQKSNALLWDTGLVPAEDLNGMFGSKGPSFSTFATGGVVRMDFSRRLDVTPNVGPGSYENVGVITIIRM